ncbi:hypothetical protein SLE2022_212130 [Rubroshorea leprosula]
MSVRPINLAHSRGTCGRRSRVATTDLACDATPDMDASHMGCISPQCFVHVVGSSHQDTRRGRGLEKGKKPAKMPKEKPVIKFSDKGTFLDVEVPRMIMTLWKRVYHDYYFTYDLFPQKRRCKYESCLR